MLKGHLEKARLNSKHFFKSRKHREDIFSVIFLHFISFYILIETIESHDKNFYEKVMLDINTKDATTSFCLVFSSTKDNKFD